MKMRIISVLLLLLLLLLLLFQVNATDADDPNTDGNGVIKYEIDSGQENRDWLAVHPVTGWVTTLVPLDRETTSSIQLTIKARDRRGMIHFQSPKKFCFFGK